VNTFDSGGPDDTEEIVMMGAAVGGFDHRFAEDLAGPESTGQVTFRIRCHSSSAISRNGVPE